MLAVIDPAWAIPANTGLLVVLTIANIWHNRRTAKRTDTVHAEVVDVKRAVGVNRRVDDEIPHAPVTVDTTADAPGRRWTDQEGTPG